MRLSRILPIAVLLVTALATPFVINPRLFGAGPCPNTQASMELCPGLQSACAVMACSGARNCLSYPTCSQTTPQMNNFNNTFPLTGWMAQQQTTTVDCNKVDGCRVYNVTGCIDDPSNPKPPQGMLPYQTVVCPP